VIGVTPRMRPARHAAPVPDIRGGDPRKFRVAPDAAETRPFCPA
jgi:hypothetical protein